MTTIFATVNRNGDIITETECGAWTSTGALGVQANDGTMHAADGVGPRARMVARLLSEESGEVVTIDMVLDAWEAIRG